MPKTPGDIALTGLASLSIASGTYSIICLVISISCTTFGPNESGVTYIFPNPTTNNGSCGPACLDTKFLNSLVNTSDAF